MTTQTQNPNTGFMMATGIVALFSLVLLGLSISNQLNASGFFFYLAWAPLHLEVAL